MDLSGRTWGIALHHGVEDVNSLLEMAHAADKNGFQSIWVTERYFEEEAFSLLGVLSAAVRRAYLGLAVTNPYTRNPALLAMAAATMDRLTKGRFILGLGRSDSNRITSIGITDEDPLSTVEETVYLLNEFLKGTVVNHDGPRFKLSNVKLDIKPIAQRVPIYLAAIGPKTLSLAARIADGVILNAYSPVNYVKFAVQKFRETAKIAGRDPDNLTVAGVIAVRLQTDHLDDLMSRCKSRIASLLTERNVGEILVQTCGYDSVILQAIRRDVQAGHVEDATRHIDDQMVREFYIIGDSGTCRRRIAEYMKAGIKIPILLPPLSDFKKVAVEVAPR